MNEVELAVGLARTPGYRYADVAGDRLYLAGQVPLDGTGGLVSVDPVAQTQQCLANLFAMVDAHGFGRTDIRRLTIYAVGEQARLADVWSAVLDGFDGEVPPATLLGVSALGYDGQLVEVDAQVERVDEIAHSSLGVEQDS